MIVDIGGGTLDVAVMEVSSARGEFVIHATGETRSVAIVHEVIVDELMRRIRLHRRRRG